VALARRGKRVLAIDNDPQGSLTILFGHDHNKLDEEEKTLYFSLVGERPLAELAIGDNQKLIPASETLAAAEAEFATNMLLNGANAMKERVQEVRDQYDFILIDCLPSLGILCLGALVASDYLLVPVETNNLSFRGVEMLFKNVAKIQARLNPKLSVLGVPRRSTTRATPTITRCFPWCGRGLPSRVSGSLTRSIAARRLINQALKAKRRSTYRLIPKGRRRMKNSPTRLRGYKLKNHYG
jgi:cellulose biosynthesis protein BcsQ